MIEFVTINDGDPALAHSPMVRAIGKTFAYIAENGPIGLTPSKAFKRVFVHWAAAEFDWPRLNAEERLSDLGRILAAGIQRMRGAQPETAEQEPDTPRYVEVVGKSRRGRRTRIRIGGDK